MPGWKTIVMMALLVVGLFGCDMARDVKDLFKHQQAAQAYLQKHYGLEADISFNVNNGVFTRITVVLKVDDVRDRSVTELETIAAEAVRYAFEFRPRAFYVALASNVLDG